MLLLTVLGGSGVVHGEYATIIVHKYSRILSELTNCFPTLKAQFVGWLVCDSVTLMFACCVCRTHHPTRSEPATKASLFNLSRQEGEGHCFYIYGMLCVALRCIVLVCIDCILSILYIHM